MIHFLDICQAFGNVGVPASVINSRGVQFLDTNYRPVSAAWMRENWRAWVASLPRELRSGGRPSYYREAWDCENHAFACMTHGNIGNALTAFRTGRGLGLAKGVMAYTATQRVIGRHAINWWMNHIGKLHFFEPATGMEVELTTGEAKTITFICAI